MTAPDFDYMRALEGHIESHFNSGEVWHVMLSAVMDKFGLNRDEAVALMDEYFNAGDAA